MNLTYECDSCNSQVELSTTVYVEDKGFENYDGHVWALCLKCSKAGDREEMLDQLQRERVDQDMT